MRFCVHAACSLCLAWRHGAIVLQASYCHKMLRESRGDHCRLSLLTIFFHSLVTLTRLWNCKWNSPLSPTCNIVCVLARTPNINYKLSNIMVGENVIIILSILYAACSNCSATPWQQMMILYGSPLISKKECV